MGTNYYNKQFANMDDADLIQFVKSPPKETESSEYRVAAKTLADRFAFLKKGK